MPLDTISLKAFRKETSSGLFDRRGSTLKMIDTALECWDEYNGTDEKEMLARLYLIFKQCERYIKKYLGRENEGYRGMTDNTGSGLRQRRINAVKDLRNLVLNELAMRAPGISKAFQNFLMRKKRGLQNNLKGLDTPYRYERSHYLENKIGQKTLPLQGLGNLSPFSGTVVHNTLEQYGTMGRVQRARLDENTKALVEFIQGNPETEPDFEIYKLLGISGGSWKVSYLNKIQRMRFMVVLNGGVFYDLNDQPFNMGNEEFMYAVDHYGCLYAAPKADNEPLERTLELTGEQGEYFNHSSFNSGREVLCAGIIYIRDGRLRYVDNNSGHYKPTLDDLRNLLLYFQQEGVDLSEVGVSYHGLHNPIMAIPFIANREEPWPKAFKMRANVYIYGGWRKQG